MITHKPRGRPLLEQQANDQASICEALRPYFESAHLDARQVFHKYIGIDLYPDAPDKGGVRVEYPRCLPDKARRGYFGEVMAGLVTEAIELVGKHCWCVPVFLFRLHDDAKHYLFDLERDPKGKRETIGRLGDDFIGLLLDENGAVIRYIVGEAKWRTTLTSSVVETLLHGKFIKDPNDKNKRIRSKKGIWNKFNRNTQIPNGMRQLQKILEEIDPEGYDSAILSMEEALRPENPRILPRTNLLIVLSNCAPSRKNMECLLPFERKPNEYTARHDLQLVEVVLKDGEKLIDSLYENLWA